MWIHSGSLQRHILVNYMEFIAKQLAKRLDDEILSVTELGDGHINDTFLVEASNGKYVAQRLSKNMDIDKLEYNYDLYSEVFEGFGWLYPKMIKDEMGRYFCADADGSNWRIYKYLDGTVLDASVIGSLDETHAKEIIYAYGKGLAKLHGILRTIQNKPKAVYPNLHDLKKYYEDYLRIKCSRTINEKSRDYDIEVQLEKLSEYYIKQSEDLLKGLDETLKTEKYGNIYSVIHGDPKISNALFIDGKVAGFLDLDTVMWGSLLDDIADAIRSCCITDGRADTSFMESFIDGYKSEALEDVVAMIDINLHDAFAKICVELALRYYMDEISGKGYFKEKSPGYRIKRTRELLGLIMKPDLRLG